MEQEKDTDRKRLERVARRILSESTERAIEEAYGLPRNTALTSPIARSSITSATIRASLRGMRKLRKRGLSATAQKV
jgi:hypothetical protein